MFFDRLTTVETVKAEYRRLAKIHHPDHGGDELTMKRLNKEYDAALQRLDGSTVKGDDGKSRTYRYNQATEDACKQVVFDLLRLRMEGVEIALIGSWVWVQGNTRPYAKALGKSGLGLSWHDKRKCWYWKPEGWRSRYSGADLGYLAAKYGYQGFERAKDSDVEAAGG